MNIGDREYHVERARCELDWAYRAERDTVAEAHLRLSALHMQRLRELDESCGGAASGR
jgi:hypothetical protein